MKNTAIPNALLVILGVSLMICVLPGTAVAGDEAPSMEFLEYLGEWETNDGDWVDPTSLADNESAEAGDVDLVYTAEEKGDEQ